MTAFVVESQGVARSTPPLPAHTWFAASRRAAGALALSGAAALLAGAGAAVLAMSGLLGVAAGVLLLACTAGAVTAAPRLRGAQVPPSGVVDAPAPRAGAGSAAAALLLAGGVGVAAGLLAATAAVLGMKGTALLVLTLAGGVGAWVLRGPLLRTLGGTPRRPGLVALPAFLRRPRPLAAPLRVAAWLVLVPTAGLAAWAAAVLGLKGIALLLGGLALGGALVAVRDREALLVLGLSASLALFLHKSIGPLYPVNSGAPAVYVTSLGVLLMLLYVIWLRSGTFLVDVRTALRRPVMWMPLVGVMTMLPSLAVAEHLGLAVAELVRLGWMYLLFLYVAVRVRRRLLVLCLLAGLGLLAVVELVVVVLQWRTGGVLGLGFLGVPDELGERITDAGRQGRPFGTIVHPVFLGAVMATLALLAMSLGLWLRGRLERWVALAFVPVCVLPLLLSRSRAAAVAFTVTAGVLVLVAAARGRLPWRVLGVGTAVIGLLCLAFLPQISARLENQFGSAHVGTELQSRTQLNDLAFEMIADSPLVGVGLNGFQQAMPRYDREGLLFEGNPVHNLFLLQAAETGYLGLAGLVAVGVALLVSAVTAARSPSPLSAALGTAMTAVLAFFVLEEMLGFSLRQEVPLALFWLLAGLTVASTAVPEQRRPRHAPRVTAPPSRPTPARRRGGAVTTCVLLLAPIAVVTSAPAPAAAAAESLAGMRVVFAATDRRAGFEEAQALYTVGADGTGLRRITPPDGRTYDFPQWALGGTKIVYSVREGGPSSPENVEMSNPDGTGRQQLTFSPWRNHQPKVSPDGTRLVFSGFVPGTRLVALYELDLATLLVRNLSAVHSASVMADADPRWSADGRRIVFARSRADHGPAPTQVYAMAADGSNRVRLTRDDHHDVDPDLSPDGRWLAFDSYRGTGTPQQEDAPHQAKRRDFHIAVRDLVTGEERTLTEGLECAAREPEQPCTPTQASAYVPLWTPDGGAVGYVAALDRLRVCICLVPRDGGEGRVLVVEPGLSITYFDWTRPSSAPAGSVLRPGEDSPADRLLVSGRLATEGGGSVPVVLEATPDLWNRTPLPLAHGREMRTPRWDRDRTRMAFSSVGTVPAGPPPSYVPAPGRREHWTLADLAAHYVPPVERTDVAAEQVWLDGPEGPRQVTHPWTEDPLDGVAAGDRRGSTEPDLSPDGRHLVVTNVSSTSGESFLLRIDLETGDVVNLTNATAGALPVADAQPRWSPDGSTLAFRSDFHGVSGLYTMDASTGRDVRAVVEDEWVNLDPAWSPDGSQLVYVSYRGPAEVLLRSLVLGEQVERLPLDDWHLVVVDVATGAQRLLTSASRSPVFAPAWSPDGKQIAFVSPTDGFQPDVYVVPAAGGPARALQVTGLLQELTVEWR